MIRWVRWAALALVLSIPFLAGPAFVIAQTTQNSLCVPIPPTPTNPGSSCQSVTRTFPLPVTGEISISGGIISFNNPLPVVVTTPISGTTAQISLSIAATNTFITALASSTTRKGCLIQNRGSNAMYVFFGTSPTTPTAFQINALQTISCAAPYGVVATDQVNVTGTAGESFIVGSQ